MPKKKSTHVCSGCDREFNKLHSLSTHHNSCTKLHEAQQITAEKEPTKKKKKNHRLLKQLLSRNSETTSEKSNTNVLFHSFLSKFSSIKILSLLQLFELDETLQDPMSQILLDVLPEVEPDTLHEPSPPSFVPPPT